MRIALLHSFYRSSQPSGENRVVLEQAEALREAGHDVLVLRRDTDELNRSAYALRAGLDLVFGNGFDPTSSLLEFKPDIVHIHNTFPNIATSWLRRWSGPVVVTLHNYRLTCSAGTFFRGEQICTECHSKGSQKAVIHGCYRNSRLASFPVAASRRRQRFDLLENTSLVITTSEVSDDVVRRYLDPNIRTVIVPNFAPAEYSQVHARVTFPYWIGLGRFSPEKGFAPLVRDWPSDAELILDGRGPDMQLIKSLIGSKRITVQSTDDRSQLMALLAQSTGMIFPSLWFDVDPQVVVEAMRAGIPIVAHRNNSAARVVTDSGSGIVYDSRDSLREALQQVHRSRELMSWKARQTYLSRWTKEVWLGRIITLYQELLM